MSGKISLLSRLILVASIIVCLGACNNSVTSRNASISTPTSNVPPLQPSSLSNDGKEYDGRTKITFLLETPFNTPVNSSIYLSGTFDDWSGGNSNKYKFSKIEDNKYQLTVEEDAGSVLQFKVTRGSWDFGEVDERGRRIGNRVLTVRNKPLFVKLVISNWNDKSEEIDNVDSSYWETEIPNYKNEPLKPSIRLNGNKISVVPSLNDYLEEGATATAHNGKNISATLQVKGLPETNNPGDYLVTYEVKDSQGRQAEPISRMLRITGKKPINYSLRSVGTTSSHLGYIEQIPAQYGKDLTKKYPLFIYHHGAGGEASSMDLSRKTSLFELSNWWGGGPARIAMRGHWNTNSPLIVLSPQRSFFESDIASIDAFVDYAIKNYQVDPTRIYMGGFSAGGYISWEYAIKYPTKIAAILPLAGTVFPESLANICNAKEVAIWAFHGADDTTVDVNDAKNSIESFNKCEPKQHAKLTLFDNAGHASHQRVLELTGMFQFSELNDPFDENIYTWLMSQSLPNN
jgi:predicted esterase